MYFPAPTPPAAPPRPSLLDQFGTRARGLFGAVGRGLSTAQNRLMPEDTGYGDLVGGGDVADARRMGIQSLAAALIAGSQDPSQGGIPGALLAGRQGYQQAIDRTAQQTLARRQVESQQGLQQKRQQILAQYQLPPGAPPEMVDRALKEMFAQFVQLGDTEMVGRLAQVIPSLAKAADPGLKWEDFGGEKALVDAHGNIVKRVAKSPSPRDPNAPDTAQQLRDQRMFTRSQQLSDDFRQNTKQYQTVGDMLQVIESVAPAALQGNAQAQMGLIFGYMKLLDPGSTVREGEYASATNTAGVPERVRTMYNKALDGQFLGTEQVQHFIEQARQQGKGWQSRFEPIRKRYEQRAKRWGINPEDVTFDYFNGLGATGAPAAAGGGGDPSKVSAALGKRK